MAPKLESILVPVDFSECSRAAIEHALFLAKPFGAKVEVLHVWEAPNYRGAEHVIVRDETGTHLPLVEYVQRQTEIELREFTAGLPVESSTASGDAFTLIVEASKHHDLVVMGTHGRGALSHLFLGSVTERVVRKAHCPVLTVHRPSPSSK
jgi:nucleotide-binding universal stress UspA family protein